MVNADYEGVEGGLFLRSAIKKRPLEDAAYRVLQKRQNPDHALFLVTAEINNYIYKMYAAYIQCQMLRLESDYIFINAPRQNKFHTTNSIRWDSEDTVINCILS